MRFPEIVTSSGRPILRLLSEGTDVSISFVVPVIENVSLSKSIVPLPLSPLNKRSFCASTVASTYALIDCWVASAVALSDIISSSSTIEVTPTKVSPACPSSN